MASRASDIAATPVDEPLDPRRWAALWFVVCANLLVFTGVTIMNVALPTAQDDLQMSDSSRQWVVTMFSLTFGGLMLLGGRLADTRGMRRCLSAGLLGYGAASVVGGLAGNALVLVAARGAQGATGAVVASAALGLLSRMFAGGPERERAFGILGAVMGLGGAAGFVVAGVLTDISWRWCLIVNAPLAVIVLWGIRRFAPADEPVSRAGLHGESHDRLDGAGAVLVTGGVALAIFGFDRAAVDGWGTWLSTTVLLGGLGLILAFVGVERVAPEPLLPLGLLTDRRRRGAYLSVGLLGMGLFSGFFLLTFALQDVLGYSPTVTGLAFVPFGLAAIASSRAVGPAMRRVPPMVVIVGGLVLAGAGLAVLTRLEVGSSYTTGIAPAFVLLGIGASAVMVASSNVVTLGAGRFTGVAGAANNASQQIGAAVGTAVISSIAASASAAHARRNDVAGDDLDATVHGLTQACAVGALVVIVGAALVAALTRLGTRAPATT